MGDTRVRRGGLRPMLSGLLLIAACVSPTAEPSGAGREGPMHIELERTGGVTGVRFAATMDTDTLTPAEAAKVRQLVDESSFFRLPARLTASTPGADRFQYRLTVRAADRSHTVDISEGALPAALRPLIDWLMAEARKPR